MIKSLTSSLKGLPPLTSSRKELTSPNTNSTNPMTTFVEESATPIKTNSKINSNLSSSPKITPSKTPVPSSPSTITP